MATTVFTGCSSNSSKVKVDVFQYKVEAAKALDNTLGAVTIKDKVYGLPLALEGYGFVYNKTIFKNAGIDADKIKTFKDLENAAKELDSQKDKLGIESVFVLPAKENWVTGLHTSNVAFGNEFKNATEAYNAKTIDFKYSNELKKLFDLQAKYAFNPSSDKGSINGVNYSTQVEEKFALGKCAMIQQGNWIYGSVKGVDEKLASNVGMLPIPLDEVKTMPWVFMGYPTGFGEEQFGPLVQKYFAGELTWNEVVQTAQKDWAESRK